MDWHSHFEPIHKRVRYYYHHHLFLLPISLQDFDVSIRWWLKSNKEIQTRKQIKRNGLSNIYDFYVTENEPMTDRVGNFNPLNGQSHTSSHADRLHFTYISLKHYSTERKNRSIVLYQQKRFNTCDLNDTFCNFCGLFVRLRCAYKHAGMACSVGGWL